MENNQNIQDESIQFFINNTSITFDENKTSNDYSENIDHEIIIGFKITGIELKEKNKTPIRQKELSKDNRVEIIKHILNIENLKPNTKDYKKSKQWIITNGSNNIKIENAIIDYLTFKIEQSQKNLKKTDIIKGIHLKYSELLNLIENWIDDEKNKNRFSFKKNDIIPEESLFKIYHNKNTGKTIIKEYKYWKKLLEDSKKDIKQFQLKYPELFTNEYFNQISSEFRNLPEMTDEMPNMNLEISKLMEEFEEDEIHHIIYILFFIFLLSNKSLSFLQIEKFWHNIYSKMTNSNRSIIKSILRNSIFFDYKNGNINFFLTLYNFFL